MGMRFESGKIALVKAQVRAEIKQLEAQYEAGEIWVGKEADVGAQISVGSVRGDKVPPYEDYATFHYISMHGHGYKEG